MSFGKGNRSNMQQLTWKYPNCPHGGAQRQNKTVDPEKSFSGFYVFILFLGAEVAGGGEVIRA
jgi:hypothetical protein